MLLRNSYWSTRCRRCRRSSCSDAVKIEKYNPINTVPCTRNYDGFDVGLYMKTTGDILPYFGKRKQVTYHLNLSYSCFCILPSVLFFQAKFYASTLILLRDMLRETSWYSIDISGNDRHILLFYNKKQKKKKKSLLSLAFFCQSRAVLLLISKLLWGKINHTAYHSHKINTKNKND